MWTLRMTNPYPPTTDRPLTPAAALIVNPSGACALQVVQVADFYPRPAKLTKQEKRPIRESWDVLRGCWRAQQ